MSVSFFCLVVYFYKNDTELKYAITNNFNSRYIVYVVLYYVLQSTTYSLRCCIIYDKSTRL